MSTIMQTHLETQFKETTTLTLKLSPPPERNHTQIDTITNCWNFLETKPSPKFTPYIPPPPPTYNKSPISYVTFDLCTENLGSESGSDMSDHDIDILSLPPQQPLSPPVNTDHQPKLMIMRKKVVAPPRTFPPPLTTIRGFNPIRVRSKREGGRLVIDAVEERSVACNYFRSDRTNGRLRLSFWDNCTTNTNTNTNTNEDHQETEVSEAGEGNENVVGEAEDMIGNSLEVGVEIGTQKFMRSSRCMEGNNNSKELCKWEPQPLWVAT